MADALTKLTKNMFIPFLDVAKDSTMKACEWKAIDLSTIFSLAMNENTEEKDEYINPDVPEKLPEDE